MPRYRFADFVLSPRQRTLARGGRPIPLIPRYFDLLLFLIERRGDAVHRREIFDGVWADVIVSDSALSQAIRTLRRTLGDDDPRAPQFIRTVSRHGYQFVCSDLIEEDDDGKGAEPLDGNAASRALSPGPTAADTVPPVDPYVALIAQLVASGDSAAAIEDQQDAAERLHALGTSEALRRLEGHPREAHARALLRDTRHLVAGAGEVPLVATRGGVPAGLSLAALRLRRAGHLAARRWLAGTIGGGAAGALAGVLGGLLLALAPGTTAPVTVVPVLAAIGAACGAVGGAGVAAGLAAGEALAVTGRPLVLVLGAAAGGGIVGGLAQLMGRWTLGALFGLTVGIGGLLEGLAIGAGVGLGYAMATHGVTAGLAAPRRGSRVAVALVTGAGGALAALGLALFGIPLVGGTLHLLAQASAGSQVLLTPLGRLLGEPEFGPLTRALISVAEGGSFGAGLAFGLTRRP